MVEFLCVVHSDDVALWCGDSARVEEVLVGRGAQWLLPTDVVLRQGAVRYLQPQSVEVVGHLGGKLELRELQFVVDLEVIADVDGTGFSEGKILVHIPPCRQPA